MANRARILALAGRLKHAADRQDWPAVTDIDREVATLLTGLAAAERLSAGESSAIDALYKVHATARLACDAECVRLAELPTHREGWMAYGMNNESREEHA